MQKDNFKRLLKTVEALSDLGPEMTAEQDFSRAARAMLSAVMQAAAAREAVLFTYSDRPSLLTSIAADGFALMPEPAIIPLLPKHAHALAIARTPRLLGAESYDAYLSANGNVAPDLFRCIAPLKVAGKLVGLAALGRREGEGRYEAADLEALELICHYIALAIHNHSLGQTLAQRVTENLRLMASIRGFYDSALETFAAAIDVKHALVQGHSIRVARYAAAIGQAMNLDANDVSALRAAGYLHDIGKVAIDKRLFGKPTALDAQEFREMADHTIIGHQIVQGVQFPWPNIPEVVRWHHERADGSGYPDGLRNDEISMPVRIIALADTFDAMTSERPYREPLAISTALHEIVRLTPHKFDFNAVQALLLQVRRDAVGSNALPFYKEPAALTMAPRDVDQLAADLQHKATHERHYLP
ncbi:MAG TPA: HD domain-containing phosphohydrolase [Terriglobales bacterium]